MTKAYAGIGSRKTPADIMTTMTWAAQQLSEQGLVLRSGGANGADQAFENGADLDLMEIFLPWKGFNENRSKLYDIPLDAFSLAASFHPGWRNLSNGARNLMARNCQQVLGENLDDPVLFVLCWTFKGGGSGGTGQAIRLANHFGIPVFDMGGPDFDTIPDRINEILENQK